MIEKRPEGYVYVGEGKTERTQIGSNSTEWFSKDPRAMAYTAAKYATVAKLLGRCPRALEVGCGDGFGSSILAQVTGVLDCVDINYHNYQEARTCWGHLKNVAFWNCDFLKFDHPWKSNHNAIVALDVLEHIDPLSEREFLLRVADGLHRDGIFICGMPTLNSQEYATDYGKAGHVNCQHPFKITETLKEYFDNVFSFGMTDGHINVGFEPMRQYQLNLAVGPKT